jgi:hypothetical protein
MTVDFIKFVLDQASVLGVQEKVARFFTMLDRVRADMEK